VHYIQLTRLCLVAKYISVDSGLKLSKYMVMVINSNIIITVGVGSYNQFLCSQLFYFHIFFINDVSVIIHWLHDQGHRMLLEAQ